MVYIQEAHATDAWQMESNVRENVLFASTRSAGERSQVAQACVVGLRIQFPAVIDDPQNSAEAAYTGWPDRLYVVNRDGRIAYKSRPGPFGFKPEEMAATLKQIAASPARSHP